MAMGEAKPSVLIPMPSRDRDRDRDLLVPPAAVATHASPSTRAGAGSDDDDDESKPSSASAAAAAAQTGREVAALPFPPISPFQLGSPRIGGGFFSQILSAREVAMRELLWDIKCGFFSLLLVSGVP